MFLLDTNVVSELRKAKAGKADLSVVTWAAGWDPEVFFLSAISILELETGVLQIIRRDATQGAVLRAWMDDQVLPTFAERVLPIDAHVAQRCAALHVPNRCAERDALIAATALVHGLTIATRNVADFVPTGAKLINPWNTAP